MRLLACETSCDETSVAILEDGILRANVVASQVRLHAEYGGVVPELAAREHLRALPLVVGEAVQQAGLRVQDLDAVAATLGPGLPQALLTGVRASQGMAFALGRPFLGIHHHEAHLYSPWMEGPPWKGGWDKMEPHVSLIASGGHTLLVLVEGGDLRHRVLGATLDDAAGECFDKVGKMLGLPYPGGPQVERLAREGRAEVHAFPRPLLRDAGDDFSFSGLKTSVRYFLDRHPGLAEEAQGIRDLCAGVQAAVVDVLVGKLLQAARRLKVRCVTASGGVTCNRAFRERLTTEAARAGFRVRLAEPEFCTDNAAMVGMLAWRRLQHGWTTEVDEDIRPNWALADLVPELR